jgi:hypothetical protein
MALDRDGARTYIARRGLGSMAVESVARTSFGRMPITLVDRARTALRVFFSESPWTVEDDAALSGVVGPGEGWTVDELAPGVRIGFGWRGGTFRMEIEVDDSVAAEAAAPATVAAAEPVPALPEHERTLGDTFEGNVVIESGRTPNQLRFATGPGGPRSFGRFKRDSQGESASVAALFREFEQIEEVSVEPNYVVVMITDATAWPGILLRVFDAITADFVPPRAAAVDRQYERALNDIGVLDARSSRDLARILDAVTSPDVAYRRLAAAKLEMADPLVTQKPWTRALEDSSRAVRRAAIRAAAHKANPDSRLLFERALADQDACVRYYGVRGLAQIGVQRAQDTMERRRRDDDVRVRLAAIAALEGQIPP